MQQGILQGQCEKLENNLKKQLKHPTESAETESESKYLLALLASLLYCNTQYFSPSVYRRLFVDTLRRY